MKSRLLSSATVLLFLLLGLVNTNLFAQITDVSTVNFQIKDPISDSWRDSTLATMPDTVGRSVQYAVSFPNNSQTSGLTKYRITLPTGTAVNEATIQNGGVYLSYTNSGLSITDSVTAAGINVKTGNDTTAAAYSTSVAPVIEVTAPRTYTSANYRLELRRGLWHSKSVSGTNTKLSTGNEQAKMAISLVNTDQPTQTLTDSTSFWVTNDDADGVRYNTGISALIFSEYFAGADTLIVVDRFGNFVPDFFNTASDSLVISVSSATTVGYFTSLSVNNADFSSALVDTLGAGNKFRVKGGSYELVSAANPFTSMNASHVIEAVNVTGSSTLANNNDDKVAGILYLGNTTTGTHTPAKMGVKLVKPTTSTVATGDSVTFTVSVYGGDKARYGAGTYFNTGMTRATTIKRIVLTTASSKTIGSLVLSGGGAQSIINGATVTGLQLTLKNLFGDNFTGVTVGSSSLDSVGFKFEYSEKKTVNATKTPQLQGGTKQANSVKTVPKARFYGTDFADRSSSPYGSWLKGGTVTSGVVSPAAVYIGMTTLNTTADTTKRDSIDVIAYAYGNGATGVADTIRIHVKPGSPVYFDLDSVAYALANVSLVEGAQFPTNMPIFALDTAYNRITNFNLDYNSSFLDNISIQSTSLKAIGFKIDGRDPLGYWHKTRTDSIRIDSLGAIGGTRTGKGLAAKSLADSSHIWDASQARSDSSRLNLGGTGKDPMGLRLLYKGSNFRISINWNPADLGAQTYAERSQDLGLFTLSPASAIDSVTTVTQVTTATAGKTDTLVVSFVAPSGNSIGPNLADSLIFIQFMNMTSAAGIPASIAAANVKVSVDGTNYYPALGVIQGSENPDSIWLATPILVDAGSSNATVYVKIEGFVSPTMADTANYYMIKVKTEASPVKANGYMTVVANSYATIKVLPPLGGVRRTVPKWLSEVDTNRVSDTLRAGVATLFKVYVGDAYGNVVNIGSAATKKLVIKSVDSTSTGKLLMANQTFDGAALADSVVGKYDTVTVKMDTLLATGAKYSVIDSLLITPAKSGSYYLVFTEADTSKKLAVDSVLIYVRTTTAGSITLNPDTTVQGQRGANLPVLTVTLKDSYGNLLPDTVITLAETFGDTAGGFVKSNDSTVTKADTVRPKANSSGVATATYKAGIGDSVAIKVTVGAVTAKYFTARTTIPATQDSSAFTFVTVPDSLSPDTTSAKTVTVDIKDGEKIKKAYLTSYSSTLTLGTDGKFTASDAIMTLVKDSVVVSTPADSVRWTASIAAIKVVGTRIQYTVSAIDNTNDTTTSVMKSFLIAPKRGKRNLVVEAVNVADVMRTVYLVAGVVPAASVKTVDYLGLDLDQSGDFDTPDLTSILAIWRGTGTLLAAAGEQQAVTAKVDLAYQAVDKANANLSINLENSGSLNVGVFRIKYDTEKYVLGEAVATDRLKDVSVVTYNNEAEGIYSVVVVNVNGRSIFKGSGAILTIPVTAVGDKFDGTGEISLLKAGFDDNVQAELSREILSPKAVLPKAFALSQNYPNPFNPSTTIAYDVPEGKEVSVRLNVYNMRGQLVRTLVNEVKSEGSYQIQWDGDDNYGRKVSSGVYFYRIIAGEFSQTRKMVILK